MKISEILSSFCKGLGITFKKTLYFFTNYVRIGLSFILNLL